MIKIVYLDKEKFYKATCNYCKCIFNYQDEDIIHDRVRRTNGQPYGDYVICPNCGDLYWINKYYDAKGWTNGCK